MATILGQITLNEISICEITGNPTVTGLDLPSGSLALDANNGKMYLKTGNGNLDWEEANSSSPGPADDLSFIFDGSISVRANGSFRTSAASVGVLVKSFSARVLEITGSFTVNANGNFVIGNNSGVLVRSV